MTTPIFGAIQPLRDGATVALVAPSGVLTNKDDVDRALANVRAFGWIPSLGEHVSEKHGYLAGIDNDRLADLNSAFLDEDVDAIWCVRGGYGAMRLVADLYYPAIRQNRKPLIGFSDVTALHCAIQRRCGLVTFHGPTARARLTPFSIDSLTAALIDQRDSCGVAKQGRVLRKGKARGRLIGGNLALITSLIGTPFAPDFEGSILIIEDINEPIYRIDRMLRQLILSGSLQRCVGLVAGDFRPPADETPTDNRTLDEVLTEAAEHAGIPCLAGAPFGHIPDQWTIPLGAIAELDTGSKSLRILGAD